MVNSALLWHTRARRADRALRLGLVLDQHHGGAVGQDFGQAIGDVGESKRTASTALAPNWAACSIIRCTASVRAESTTSLYCGTSPAFNERKLPVKPFAKPTDRTSRPQHRPIERSMR